MDVDVGQMGGAVDAAPAKLRKIAPEELMTQHLERFISAAVRKNDGSLTMRTCKDMLATHFGELSVEEQELVESVVRRLVTKYTSTDQQIAPWDRT